MVDEKKEGHHVDWSTARDLFPLDMLLQEFHSDHHASSVHSEDYHNRCEERKDVCEFWDRDRNSSGGGAAINWGLLGMSATLFCAFFEQGRV